jgi:hypothetical protein
MKGVRTMVGAAVIAVALGIGACAETDEAAGNCIILANGGNKLCGADAATWCDTTDEFREGDPALGLKGDNESQAACDQIRGK